MDERFNAARNGDSYNCPRCYRARTLVLVDRAKNIWQCGQRGSGDGCCALFRLERAPACPECDTLVRFRESAPVRQSPEEFAARRERFLPW